MHKLFFALVLFVSFTHASYASGNSKEIKQAMQTLPRLPGMGGISDGEVASLVTFINKKMGHNSKACLFPKNETGLRFDVAYDPQTGNAFIDTANGAQLGRGSKKVVTTAVLYNAKQPQIIAKCIQQIDISRERKITTAVQGVPGVMKVYGFVDYKQHGQLNHTMYCKYYREGSLSKVMLAVKDYKFSFAEKVHMAHTIMQGLSALHSKNIIHRDLGTGNYLLDITGKGKDRVLDIVIADFGSARFITEAEGERPQGHSAYIAPEGVLRSLKAEEYYPTEVFAVGSFLYWLIEEKKPEWVETNFYKSAGSHEKRYNQYIHMLNKEMAEERAALEKRKGILSKREQFRLLVMTMLHPDPKKRGTAAEVCRALTALDQ